MRLFRGRPLVVVLVLAVGAVAPAFAPAGAQEPDPPDLEAVPLAPAGAPVTTEKAPSSRIAETDPELLDQAGGALVPVLIKLDYDAVASYGGGLRGLPATSPSVTGEALTGADATTSPYARQVARDEAAIVADIRAAVPRAEIGQSLRIVYGGVAARVPADAVEAILGVDGVVAVQADEPQQLLTDSTPGFLGVDDVWAAAGGTANAGRGVLVGNIDSGVWPEHPSFADDGSTPPAPTDNAGQPIVCDYGDNPLTPATDVFACQDKLVGGRAFLDTYNVEVGGDVYPDSARDSNGHGTHTLTTAAGNAGVAADPLGIARGDVSGMAPGAWAVAYKACGAESCYPSDTSAAVQQAILDGVDVLNYSISGGSNPATDPVELAFLDAFAAGMFVSTSAGNAGPGADTVDHNGPWVTTVAATSPSRTWQSTLSLDGGAATFAGTSLTAGLSTALPVVAASAPPYSNAACTSPAPPGLFTGKIVACDRLGGGSRVGKGFNVKQGGAAGMVMYNSSATPLLTAENHWLPSLHIQDGAGLLTYLASHPTATGTISQGASGPGTPDRLAVFSSRGPGGLTIKPDLGAPGQQVLAGHTPTPEDVSGGPPGNLFRAIDGTSMAAPHVAGSAALLRQRHPTWTPAQVRSALMGSATAAVTEEDGTSPADPFDIGAGRIRVDLADAPGLILDETAGRMGTLGLDPLTAVHLNIGSIDAPTVPGRLTTTRTVTNPGAAATYTAATQAGPGSSITVTPSTFTLGAGETRELTVTIDTTNAAGAQEFGAVELTAPGRAATRWPVAFQGRPGDVSIASQGCVPSSVPALDTSTCTYTVDNQSYDATTVDLRAEGDAVAEVISADQGATTAGGVATADDVALAGRTPGVPTVAPGSSPAGYLPLDVFGTTPTPIGDEQFLAFDVPAYLYNGETYDKISVSSNGYAVAGPAENADQICCNLAPLPDPARPNDVLAPFWTDMDGTGAPGVFATILTDGVSEWLVIEWRVNVFGTSSRRTFQMWIGVNGTQDISFAYDPANLPALPPGQDLLVGAENRDGSGGSSLPLNTAPTTDLRVTSTDPSPGASVTWNVEVRGTTAGTATIEATAGAPIMAGSDVATATLAVTALPLPTVTDQPDDLTVDALETATFTAAATGGTFARWEEQAPGGSTWSTVAGATTATLSFTAHGADSGSKYRAVFANATGHETTSDAATLTVDQLATTTVAEAEPVATDRGEAVTFSATVTPATATGTVQFAVDGVDHGAPVAVTGGTATAAPTTAYDADDHTLTATYSGDGDHAGSSDTDQFTVLLNATTTAVAVSPTAPSRGQDVTFTATVAPSAATGTVQFAIDGIDVGSPVAVVAGSATSAPVSDVAAGAHTVTATYSGSADHATSSGDADFTVSRNPSTTTIVDVAPDIVGSGDDVVASVSVSPAPPGGTVEITVDGDPFGAPVALDGNGEADVTIPDLAVGDHTIGARFPGDDDLDPSEDSEAVTVHTADEAFVRRAYQVVLGRNGDASGIAFWVDVLDDGAARRDVTTLMAVGAEGRNRLVTRTFQRVLGRTPDAAARSYWAGRVAAGLSAEDLLATLLGTLEAHQRAGGTDAGYVELLYQVHLGRAGNGPGAAYWLTQMVGHDTPGHRRVVALAFGRSAEASRVAVARAGVEACGAAPSPAPAVALWTEAQRHPLRMAGVILALRCPPGDDPA